MAKRKAKKLAAEFVVLFSTCGSIRQLERYGADAFATVKDAKDYIQQHLEEGNIDDVNVMAVAKIVDVASKEKLTWGQEFILDD